MTARSAIPGTGVSRKWRNLEGCPASMPPALISLVGAPEASAFSGGAQTPASLAQGTAETGTQGTAMAKGKEKEKLGCMRASRQFQTPHPLL